MAECTIYDKLRYIAETKELIKNAIESQDVEVLESATFRQYAEYITEIRKVSSVNGMQGDVVLTIEDLGGITLSTLEDYAKKEEVENVYLALPTKVSELENDKGYITADEVPDQDLSNYVTNSQLASALNTKQNVLVAGNGISITNNTISLDYTFNLFEVVRELPEGEIDANKVYLVYDETGGENNTYIEYLYVNNQWEELGKHKVNVDLGDYVKKNELKTINGQSIIGEGNIEIQGGSGDLSDYYTKSETDTLLDEKAEVIELTQEEYDALLEKENGVIYIITDGEEVNLNAFATKEEVNSKQDIIDDLNTIRSNASKGATALQSIPSEYITESELNSKGYALASDIPDITTKQDTLVSGVNIKTVNGRTLLGEGNIEIQGGSGGGSNVIELTLEEYNSITEYQDAFYVITDVNNEYYTKDEIDTLIGGVENKITEINNLI